VSALLGSAGIQHLIAGLAIIGALAALAATGTITGSDAVGGILGVGGVLLGSSAVNLGASSVTTTDPPTA
jgi:hypothetical protein